MQKKRPGHSSLGRFFFVEVYPAGLSLTAARSTAATTTTAATTGPAATTAAIVVVGWRTAYTAAGRCTDRDWRALDAVEVRLIFFVELCAAFFFEFAALDEDSALVGCRLTLVELMTRPGRRG